MLLLLVVRNCFLIPSGANFTLYGPTHVLQLYLRKQFVKVIYCVSQKSSKWVCIPYNRSTYCSKRAIAIINDNLRKFETCVLKLRKDLMI